MFLNGTDYTAEITQLYTSYKDKSFFQTHYYLGTQLVLNELGDLKGKNILDFGCGGGYEAFLFAQLGAHVTAIDHSADQIQFALKHHQHKNVAYDQIDDGNLSKLIKTGAKFDIVTASFVFCAIGEDKTIFARLSEISKILKDDGKLIILSNNPEESDGKNFISWDCKKGITKQHGVIFKVTIHGNVPFDVNDFYRDQFFYINAITSAGLSVTKVIKPKADIQQAEMWQDEVFVAPTTIFVAEKKDFHSKNIMYESPIITL